MTNYTLESFISFCDDMMIAEEKLNYNRMRSAQISPAGLMVQLVTQRNICKSKFKEAKAEGECELFIDWLNKRKEMMQRKINGKEIKSKKMLQKFIALYDEYLRKATAEVNKENKS